MESQLRFGPSKVQILALAKSRSKEADAALDLRKQPRRLESLIKGSLLLCGVISIFTTIGIVAVLGSESINLFTQQLWENSNKQIAIGIDPTMTTFELEASGRALEAGATLRLGEEIMHLLTVDGNRVTVERGVEGTRAVEHAAGLQIFTENRVSLVEFFTTTDWVPQLGQFGVLPLINSTLMTSLTAMIVALPLGLGAAIYMSEYAHPRRRAVIKPILEILAGVPTVVFGYFALTFMTPLLRSVLGIDNVEIFNTASAGIVVGILIIPLVSSMSEDALSAVPRSLREASYGLGATRFETTIKVVIPAALSGIIAASIVAISRAIGETMIVAIAAGAGPSFTFNPFEAAETMTGHIARISGGDLSYDSIDYNSIFAIGLTLFGITLVLNMISRVIISRFREVYE